MNWNAVLASAHPKRFRDIVRWVYVMGDISFRIVTPIAAAALGASLLVAIPQTATAAPPTITVGSSPRGVAIAADESFALVANGAGNSVSRIRLSDNTVVATISVASAPWGVAINEGATHAYVAQTASNTVSRIDLSTNTVDAIITVGSAPRDVRISPDGTFFYVTNSNAASVSRVRTSDNAVVRTVSLGYNPTTVDFAPDGSFAYVVGGGVDAPAPNDGTSLTRLSTADDTVVATTNLGTGNAATGVAISPDGEYAYVAQTGANKVSRIRNSDQTVDTTFDMGTGRLPLQLDYTADGASVFVINSGNATVARIDTATNTVASTIGVGNFPRGLAAAPTSGLVLVANNNSNSVSRIMTPTAPTIAATAGDAGASIAFTAADGRGLTVSNYEYSTDDGATWAARNPASTASPLTISGLTNATTYDVRLRAVSEAGPGTASDAVTVTPVRAAPTVSSVTESSGRPGASVTLAGDAFSDATAVTFGGKAAAFTVDSDESISAIVPLVDAPGAVDVEVVNSGGTGSKVGAFTYTDPTPNEAYCDNAPALINGDFEVVPEQAYLLKNQASWNSGGIWTNVSTNQPGFGWKFKPTSGEVDDSVDILRNFGGVPATSGNLYTEINSNSPGMLYQDIATIPGETLRWRLDHRARYTATNTMEVLIGSPTGTLSRSGPELTTDQSAWVEYSGTYTVPVGQTMTRFGFKSISPDGSNGNLLDSIVFTRDGCASAPVVTSVVPGPGSARVTFTPGDDGGRPVRGYAYSVGGGEWVSVTPVNNSFTVPGLTNRTAASLRVRAVTDATAGAPSVARAVTPTDVPPSPRSLTPAAGKISWQAPEWTANDTLTTYTVVYKPWRLRNDNSVRWAVYARRTTPVTDALPLEVRMNASRGVCGAENAALGWTQCPVPRGGLSSAESEGYAFRVFSRTATKLGPMSAPVQYIQP